MYASFSSIGIDWTALKSFDFFFDSGFGETHTHTHTEAGRFGHQKFGEHHSRRWMDGWMDGMRRTTPHHRVKLFFFPLFCLPPHSLFWCLGFRYSRSQTQLDKKFYTKPSLLSELLPFWYCRCRCYVVVVLFLTWKMLWWMFSGCCCCLKLVYEISSLFSYCSVSLLKIW